MKRRRVPGLRESTSAPADIPDGVFLVQVVRARHQWQATKTYFTVSFKVLAPQHWIASTFSARLYETRKALWKLNWFLRDFGYDPDLLAQDEVDERALRGLQGVVKIGHAIVDGRAYINLEAFAPAARWEEFSGQHALAPPDAADAEVAS